MFFINILFKKDFFLICLEGYKWIELPKGFAEQLHKNSTISQQNSTISIVYLSFFI